MGLRPPSSLIPEGAAPRDDSWIRRLKGRRSTLPARPSVFRLGVLFTVLGGLGLQACGDGITNGNGDDGLVTTGAVEGSGFVDVDGTGSQGSVDEPARDIGVRIVPSRGGGAVAGGTTDSLGAFRLDAVPVGEYRFQVDSATVPDTLRVSGADTAVFVLTPGQTVQRTFRLSFPSYSLEEVRGLEPGLRVFTHGIALNPRFPFGDGVIHLKEGDVHLRVTDAERSNVGPQDSVRILGRTATEAGRPILTDARVFILQAQAVPEIPPEEVTTRQARDADDGRLDAALVRIRDARILDTVPEGDDLVATVDDGTGPVDVHLRGFLEFDRSSFEPGTRQFGSAVGLLAPVEDGTGETRWRVMPRFPQDVSVEEWVPPAVSASESTVEAAPETVVADGEEEITVTVTLRTDDGSVIDDELTVLVSVAEGPGEPTSAEAVFDPETLTYTSALTSTAAGEATVSVTADGVALAQQVQIAFIAGPPAAMDAVAGQGQTGTAGEPLGDSLVVRVADAFGNPVEGVEVTWTPGEGSGTADPATTATDADGRASTSWTLGSDDGEQTLVASAQGVEEAVTFTATAEPPVGDISAETSSVVADPTEVVADGETASTVTVELRDELGNPVTGVSGGSFILSGLGGATFTGIEETGTQGTYEFEVRNTTAESLTITVTVDDVTLNDRAEITFVPGPIDADESLVVADPTAVTADGIEESTITVTLRDGQGNVIGEAATVVLEIVSGPGEAVLDPLEPSFNPGDSTYTATISSTETGTATIGATADGTLLSAQATVQFTVGDVDGEQSEATADPTTRVADGVEASTITILLRDGEGNVIEESRPVNLTTVEGIGTFSTTEPAFDPATNSYTSELTSTQAGTATIRVEADGEIIVPEPQVEFLPGPISAEESQVEAAPDTVTADGAEAATVSVTLRDQFGNVIVEPASVVLSVSGVGVLGTSSPSFDAADSTYSTTLTSTDAGTATVTAEADGISLVAEAVVDFVAGAISATVSSVTADPATDVSADGTDASTVSVELRDAEGNEISGVEAGEFSVSLVGDGGGEPEAGSVTETGTPGTYTFEVTNTTAEAVTVTVTARGTQLDDTPTIQFVAGEPASLTIVDGDGQTGTVGTELDDFLVVEVRDAENNLVSGAEVTWTPSSGSGTADPPSSLTDAEGLARTAWTLGEDAGVRTLTATVTGVTSVEFTATAEPGPVSATVSSVTASPTDGVTADGADSSRVEAVVRDEFGNRISGLTEEDFLILLQGDGADEAVRGPINELLSPPARYVFDVTNTAVETVTVTVTVTGVTLEDQPQISFEPGEADVVDAATVSGPAIADGTDELEYLVTVTDLNDNPVSGVTVDATHDGVDVTFTGEGDSQTTDGEGEVTFTATSNTTQTLTFTFTEPDTENSATAEGEFVDELAVTTTELPEWTVNEAGYAATLEASGGTEPYAWAVTDGALPDGLSLSESTGEISGTPSAADTSEFTVQVTDANDFTATAALVITINPQPSITTDPLPNATVGVAYSETLTFSGGTPPVEWALLDGELPPGLGLDPATGEIGGIPTEAGTFNFTVRLTDVAGAVDDQALTIVVNPE